MGLKSLEQIRKAVKDRPAEIVKARKNGAKVVGWINYNIPEEIIHALGLIPVRLGTGGDERLVELGSRYISTKNCVFVREIVGLFAEKKDPYIQNSDLVAIDATCLQVYRVAELIKYYFKVETTILPVPRNFDKLEGREYFRREVEAFTKKLEDFSGKKLDQKKLDDSIRIFNETRKAIKTLYKYQSAANAPVTWRETFEVVHAGYYLDRAEYLSLLNTLLKELKDGKGKSAGIKPDGEARVLLSGSIIPPGDTKLIDIIERSGGRIVGDDLWSGLTPSLDITVRDASIKGLADAYLRRVPHAALPYLDLASDRRLKNLKKQVKAHKAQGVIYHTLRYCDAFTFKANETKNILQKAGIPFLEIHTEYAGSDVEPIRTRAEAFIEMIKSNNELEALS
jgi:benzoyl-CoA reductase/2-hydroxyglutaryl-CoA dehydratase subunit BcrC/BadD/HgdB